MALEATEVGTSGPASPPETAPATPDKAPERPGGQESRRSGGLPSNAELARKAHAAFEAARKASSGEGGGKADGGKPEAKADGKAAQAPAKGDGGKASTAKADPPGKAHGDKAQADGRGGERDAHGRFVSGEGGAQRAPDGKAQKADALGKAESHEPEAKAEQAPPKARPRSVDGRPPGHPDAEITDAQLADSAELDRRFTALRRESRQARDRLDRANQAQAKLDADRAAWKAEQEAASKAPGRLDKAELSDLAVSDPIAFLERIGVAPEAFHRALLSAGTPDARVDRLERRYAQEREERARQQREAEEARRREESERSDLERRQATEMSAEAWADIREMLTGDDSRPTVARLAAGRSTGALVRQRLEEIGRESLRDLAVHNRMSEDRVAKLLTPEQRRAIFGRNLDRLEDELAEEFGPPARVDDPAGARGGPTAESGAGPRSAGKTPSPPEGTQTLTPRLASESSARTSPMVKSQHQLKLEAQRAFERALGGSGGALRIARPRARGPARRGTDGDCRHHGLQGPI